MANTVTTILDTFEVKLIRQKLIDLELFAAENQYLKWQKHTPFVLVRHYIFWKKKRYEKPACPAHFFYVHTPWDTNYRYYISASGSFYLLQELVSLLTQDNEITIDSDMADLIQYILEF